MALGLRCAVFPHSARFKQLAAFLGHPRRPKAQSGLCAHSTSHVQAAPVAKPHHAPRNGGSDRPQKTLVPNRSWQSPLLHTWLHAKPCL